MGSSSPSPSSTPEATLEFHARLLLRPPGVPERRRGWDTDTDTDTDIEITEKSFSISSVWFSLEEPVNQSINQPVNRSASQQTHSTRHSALSAPITSIAMGRRDDEDKPTGLEALRRRSSSSRTSASLNRRVSSQTSASASTRTTSSTTRHNSIAGSETPPPLMRSSPSVGSSSYAFSGSSVMSPLRRELDLTRGHDGDISAAKLDLAHRLSMLAKRLTYGDSMEELVALHGQVDQLEQALGGGTSPSIFGSPPLSRKPRPLSLGTPVRKNRGSDLDGSAIFSSPSSSFRNRFADQLSPTPSASMMHHHDESEDEEPPPPKKGMTAAQSNRVIAELVKLNEELETTVTNLKARQEESDVSFNSLIAFVLVAWKADSPQHIHKLLVDRAERAAQRIIWLQNRITYLEEELTENDTELTHLRVCLKAVEMQLPPHPDRELQRCFAVFKDGYRAIKKKRAARSNMVSHLGYDTSIAASSPARINDDTQGDGVLFGCNGMIDWNDDGATQPATIDDTRI
ncbi:hypothetical protein MKX07_003897 [Trichoderma sp. CBMAI-0711]|nr:hypothetical protein MKX07_003897 [Trichoderma sp. CBMAI-0711]